MPYVSALLAFMFSAVCVIRERIHVNLTSVVDVIACSLMYELNGLIFRCSCWDHAGIFGNAGA